jgi:hypothetical protein
MKGTQGTTESGWESGDAWARGLMGYSKPKPFVLERDKAWIC